MTIADGAAVILPFGPRGRGPARKKDFRSGQGDPIEHFLFDIRVPGTYRAAVITDRQREALPEGERAEFSSIGNGLWIRLKLRH